MATDPDGFWDHELVAAYLIDCRDDPDPRCLADEVDCWRDPKTLRDPLPPVVLGPDGKANLSLPVNECLCLDVGCWAGDGPKSEANHPRHRDFGVVCGNVAVLCSYPTRKKSRDVRIEKKLEDTLPPVWRG